MNRISITIALMLFSLSTAIADEQRKTIPLDKIWTYRMPGTRDVYELEPKLDVHDPAYDAAFANSRVNQIARFLSNYTPNEGELAETAFVVLGTGKEALKNARSILNSRDIKQQSRTLPKDTELSLVFFTYVTGRHPKINSVEESHHSITVRYQFIAPEEPSAAAVRFALIPIGTLPMGTVEVKVEQLPPKDFAGRAVPPKRDVERFVSGSFSFDVK